MGDAGGVQIAGDERDQLQKEIDEGKDPCPGWASPKLAIGRQGLTLNAERIEGGSSDSSALDDQQ